MTRVFFDASVLFSAAYSDQGAASELVTLAIRGDLTIVMSELVVEEARRNLMRKAPEAVALFEHVVEVLQPEMVNVALTQIIAAAEYTAVKDAPIVAAAKAGEVDALLTFDDRHLLQERVMTHSGLTIERPGEFLKRWRQDRSQSRA